MQVEDTARVVVRGLGLAVIGVSLSGFYDLITRPDVFAGTADLPREFEKLGAVLSILKAHMEAWALTDGVLRSVSLGVGLYMLFGGGVLVRLLCRGMEDVRSA